MVQNHLGLAMLSEVTFFDLMRNDGKKRRPWLFIQIPQPVLPGEIAHANVADGFSQPSCRRPRIARVTLGCSSLSEPVGVAHRQASELVLEERPHPHLFRAKARTWLPVWSGSKRPIQLACTASSARQLIPQLRASAMSTLRRVRDSG
jgi:hypothetical protein